MNGSRCIVCDLDNVLADTKAALLDYCREHYKVGIGMTPEEVTAYHLHECVKGLSQEQYQSIFSDMSFWARIRPVPRAQGFVTMLRELLPVRIATDRRSPRHLRQFTRGWLHAQDFRADAVHFVAGGILRAEFCMLAQAAIAIDDNPDNAREIAFWCPVILIDQPYNQGELPANVYRAGDYREAYNLALRLVGMPEREAQEVAV